MRWLEAISSMPASSGALARRRRSVFPGWVDERARRAGSLLGEIRPEFVAAFERGRELDLWDAAATVLGEDGQTVP